MLQALEDTGQRDNTIVIFTSDHGYHLGEHDLWSKVSIHEESAIVPLIIHMPGKKSAVCHSFVELLDLYPTISSLCGLPVSPHLQGKDISRMFDDPATKVRSAILSSGKGRLYRTNKWAFLNYGKSGELYDMEKDPKQYTNLIDNPEYSDVLANLKTQLAAKLEEISKNDLPK